MNDKKIEIIDESSPPTNPQKSLTVVSKEDFMPMLTVEDALARYDQMNKIVQTILVEGRDYGSFGGVSKPTLLKAGAEKLTTFFGLSTVFIMIETVQDWTGEHHSDEPFFNYRYKCQLWRGDLLIGEGVGSCNSWEGKYRYRNAKRACPACGVEAIIKGKEEFGGGYVCWKRENGCGAKFGDNDEQITGQEVGKVKNDNPADLVNTIDKMAQKRALVAATLIACNASDHFTQDIEDMPSVSGGAAPSKTDATSEISAADAIDIAKTMIKKKEFQGNDFLTLGDKLGLDKGTVTEVKRKFEGENNVTDFPGAALALIKRYENGS